MDYIFSVHLTEDYCFIEVKYGSTEAKDCFDKTLNLFKKDVLGDNLTHTGEQFFIFANFENEVVLFSDSEKKGIFLTYLKANGINVKAYDIANDIDQFANNVTKISNVKLKLTNNLFLQEYFSPKFNSDWDNIYPETCEVKMNFDCKIDKKTLSKKFNDFKSDCSIEEFEFSGEDSESRLLIINKKALIMKQDIKAVKADDGYYDAREVERELLEKK